MLFDSGMSLVDWMMAIWSAAQQLTVLVFGEVLAPLSFFAFAFSPSLRGLKDVFDEIRARSKVLGYTWTRECSELIGFPLETE